jgi:hypothetical protein
MNGALVSKVVCLKFPDLSFLSRDKFLVDIEIPGVLPLLKTTYLLFKMLKLLAFG